MVLYLLPYENFNNTDDEYAELSPIVLLVYTYFFVRQICLRYISQKEIFQEIFQKKQVDRIQKDSSKNYR